MALRSRNKVSADFNMSSLADIIFLLLIFFLLTSRIVTPTAVKVDRPTSKIKSNQKPVARISVDKGLQYYVDDNRVAFDQLEAVLEEKLAEKENKTVLLDMDKSISIEKLVEMYDLAADLEMTLVLSADPKKKKRR